jgi:hypothetical protein
MVLSEVFQRLFNLVLMLFFQSRLVGVATPPITTITVTRFAVKRTPIIVLVSPIPLNLLAPFLLELTVGVFEIAFRY